MPATVPQNRRFQADSFDALYGFLKEGLECEPETVPVLTGPTASGKSAMAMKLAEDLGAEIISCDATQVYRGFDIGSAKASKKEQEAVPHHMLDRLDPCDSISVASYTGEVSGLIQSVLERGKRPIVCGGSVQYISALLDGLRFTKLAPDPLLRQEIKREIEERGLEESWAMIQGLDPDAAARIAPTDRRRMARFFELYQQTGKTKSELNLLSKEEGPGFPFSAYWLDWSPRQALYDRINSRVEAMYRAGLLDEVRALMAAYPDYDRCPAFRGIGYREAVAHLQGEMTEEEARELTARSTRRYAKRQQTWLRKRSDLFLLLLESSGL